MPVYQFYEEQKIEASVEDLWEFISSPGNLKKITPDHMGFDITTKHLATKMYPGMIISYKVSPLLKLNMTWVTEITHVEEKAFFVDEQRVGPYRIWHHEHRLIPKEGAVLMTDLVTYQPPMGFLGGIANSLIIKNKLKEIFKYRKKVLADIFK